METFLLILGMTVVTFGVRYPVLAWLSRKELPKPLFQALEFVPVSVLSAIVLPMVIAPNGSIDLALDNAHLLAALIAIIVAWFSKHLLWTILIGMAAFLALQHGF